MVQSLHVITSLRHLYNPSPCSVCRRFSKTRNLNPLTQYCYEGWDRFYIPNPILLPSVVFPVPVLPELPLLPPCAAGGLFVGGGFFGLPGSSAPGTLSLGFFLLSVPGSSAPGTSSETLSGSCAARSPSNFNSQ